MAIIKIELGRGKEDSQLDHSHSPFLETKAEIVLKLNSSSVQKILFVRCLSV
nr:MAG TPA: hypothetical protein [Caudoviricetes sp.]DAW66725.1 MAG TPA: hypothetical protein [Caudoviricetes sp.]DAW73239.1 MAG TPA: hypothetical protein [Caudoviricetes sp.]